MSVQRIQKLEYHPPLVLDSDGAGVLIVEMIIIPRTLDERNNLIRRLEYARDYQTDVCIQTDDKEVIK